MLQPDDSLEQKCVWLRRYYRRRMLQLQAESIYRREPIFSTLGKTSDLADQIIQAAYEIAVQDACRATARERPQASLQVVALGRLGLREFDLASDADVVFVVPDEGVDDKPWWTQVV